MKKLFIAMLTLAVLLCMAHGRAEAELKYIGVNVGDPAPDFTLQTINGKTIRLSSYKGKNVVLLDFWATWCNVCKSELSEINRNYKKYRDEGYEVLSIVLNASDIQGVREIKNEKDLVFPILLDSDWEVSKKYGLEGPIPVKVVVDAKGIIRFTHFGEFPHGENEIPYVVEELLTELPQDTAGEE